MIYALVGLLIVVSAGVLLWIFFGKDSPIGSASTGGSSGSGTDSGSGDDAVDISSD